VKFNTRLLCSGLTKLAKIINIITAVMLWVCTNDPKDHAVTVETRAGLSGSLRSRHLLLVVLLIICNMADFGHFAQDYVDLYWSFASLTLISEFADSF